MKNTRKGFTLVELLIVIVVIGILSAMMMLSSTEAVTSAKASNIVSNLRNLKTAALAYYTDNMDKLATEDPDIKDIWPYLSNSSTTTGEGDSAKTTYSIPDSDNYKLALEGSAAGQKTWFLEYEIKGSATEVSKIEEKLAGRAKSVGLLATATSGSAAYSKSSTTPTKVYMLVR